MNLYKFDVDVPRFARLEMLDMADVRVFMKGFQLEPMTDRWRPLRVEVDRDDLARGLLIGDFPDIAGSIIALSIRAVDALHDLLVDHGELLPLESDDGEYFLFNVLAQHDVMDTERSEARYLSRGRVMTLDRLVLKEPRPQDLSPIFKLPQWRRGAPLLTESFVDAIERNGLTGFRRRLIT